MRIIAIFLLFISCQENEIHSCKYINCPYIGIQEYAYFSFVAKYYTEDEDTFHLDMLHLQHPNMEYDEIEYLFLNP